MSVIFGSRTWTVHKSSDSSLKHQEWDLLLYVPCRLQNHWRERFRISGGRFGGWGSAKWAKILENQRSTLLRGPSSPPECANPRVRNPIGKSLAGVESWMKLDQPSFFLPRPSCKPIPPPHLFFPAIRAFSVAPIVLHVCLMWTGLKLGR